PGIWKFIWNHCIVVNHILQCLQNIGATVLAKKFVLAALSAVTHQRSFHTLTHTAVIVGHKCTFEGRIPEESKVQKIHDWPEGRNLTQVHGFLSVC
ncbi:hypothetical protein M404DRAFT_102930, partial [Pisolithus tinctorius Marx 270]